MPDTPKAIARIDAKDLVAAMNFSKRSVEVHPHIKGLGTSLLVVDGDRVTLQSTNLDVYSSQVLDTVEHEGSAAVCFSIREALGLIGKVSRGESATITVDSSEARIDVSGRVATVALRPVDEFPRFGFSSSRPQQFSATIPFSTWRVLQRVSYAMSKREARFTLQAIELQFQQDSLSVTASDGHRLARCSAPWSPRESDVLPPKSQDGRRAVVIPSTVIDRLSRWPDDSSDFVLSWGNGHQIEATSPGCLLGANDPAGVYPDVDRVIARVLDYNVTLNRRRLLDAARRGSSRNGTLRALRFDRRKGGLRVSSLCDGEIGVSELISGPEASMYPLGAFVFGVQAAFLVEALDKMIGEEVTLATSPDQQIVIRSEADEMFAIIMPIRLDPPKKKATKKGTANA